MDVVFSAACFGMWSPEVFFWGGWGGGMDLQGRGLGGLARKCR